ncbi:NUDIX hydrolase [Shewanella putrefaciens]|uniref:NUDIX domain-containing protein n=1 Tax=Shewanella putrefaciens TaxID=24 RepID=A0ABX8XGY2_SHEPU|nr:NUDIX domain-containing protein [Shewanella putrefaciens]AVV82352.1 DNA mismatch repair protein MutT [Shewanella putrefaciens]MCT8941752.1 NUDIX domain-containing protein [Shewanella putrefaciens]QSE51177.1 NUDIX domain-containing protein [Shewanella putrefaciens]QYX74588.1 NUDIX domain-containing protein [Shewanella putrefaciens]GGN18020.1 DNA mismatch repair protein MutT [Shewanella putrefaciens]
MRLLKSTQDPAVNLLTARVFHRRAARAIVLSGDDILLLYTQKYHDYSLPGGGIDEGESVEAGLIRELREETGAIAIKVLAPFSCYEEFRPWYRENANVVHMESYCYQCEIDIDLGVRGLGTPTLEAHEIKNGMRPEWINIHQAIAHNEDVRRHSPHKGQSIERETYLLKRIVEELLN